MLRACFPAAVLTLAALPLAAQTLPPPQNVVSLNASATVEVTKDVLTVAFAATREGPDAGTVQNQLKAALDAALAEARKAARPGQLDVQTGNFSLSPRYAPKNAGIAGWQGSAEMLVSGRDIPAVAAITGRIQTMTISRTYFTLSREAREKVDADVTAQAIAAFRNRADTVSKQFGFGSYSIREVAVNTDESGSQPVPMYRMRAEAAQAGDAALPVEAGKARVNANVSGSVQMSPR